MTTQKNQNFECSFVSRRLTRFAIESGNHPENNEAQRSQPQLPDATKSRIDAAAKLGGKTLEAAAQPSMSEKIQANAALNRVSPGVDLMDLKIDSFGGKINVTMDCKMPDGSKRTVEGSSGVGKLAALNDAAMKLRSSASPRAPEPNKPIGASYQVVNARGFNN